MAVVCMDVEADEGSTEVDVGTVGTVGSATRVRNHVKMKHTEESTVKQ